ncbi:MAG: glycosyltransferase family 9 protein [Bacteriovoracaceae bacterium]
MTKTVAPKKILVVKNRAMGDAVLGLSAIQYCQDIFPKVKITYATPEWMEQLFIGEDKLIEKVIPLKFKSIFDWWSTYNILKKEKYDVILELNQSGRSGSFFKLFSRLQKTPYYFHNHNFKQGDFVVDQGLRKPNIQRDLDFIFSYATKILNLSLPIPNYLHYEPKLENNSKKEQVLILGVVATRETKMWPSHYWPQFLTLFHEHYPQWKVLIPVSGNDLDQKIMKEIFPDRVPHYVECLELPLDKLKTVLKKGTLYIGNDTGLKHLSIALGMKSLSFFGPEEPLEWHPYNQTRHAYFFVEPLECRTLTSHYCGLNHCSVMACMKPFTPEKVLQKSISLLS